MAPGKGKKRFWQGITSAQKIARICAKGDGSDAKSIKEFQLTESWDNVKTVLNAAFGQDNAAIAAGEVQAAAKGFAINSENFDQFGGKDGNDTLLQDIQSEDDWRQLTQNFPDLDQFAILALKNLLKLLSSNLLAEQVLGAQALYAYITEPWLRNHFDREALGLVVMNMQERPGERVEVIHWLGCALRFLSKVKKYGLEMPYTYMKMMIDLNILGSTSHVLRALVEVGRDEPMLTEAITTNVSLCTDIFACLKEVRNQKEGPKIDGGQKEGAKSDGRQEFAAVPGGRMDAMRRRHAPSYDPLDWDVLVDIIVAMGAKPKDSDSAYEKQYKVADVTVQCLISYILLKDANQQGFGEGEALSRLLDLGKLGGLNMQTQQGVAAIVSLFCKDQGHRMLLYTAISNCSSTALGEWINTLEKVLPDLKVGMEKMSSTLYPATKEEAAMVKQLEEHVDSSAILVWGFLTALAEGFNASPSQLGTYIIPKDIAKRLAGIVQFVEGISGCHALAAAFAAMGSSVKGARIALSLDPAKIAYEIPVRLRASLKVPTRGMGVDVAVMASYSQHAGVRLPSTRTCIRVPVRRETAKLRTSGVAEATAVPGQPFCTGGSRTFGMQECGLAMLALLMSHQLERARDSGESLESFMLSGQFRKQMLQEGVWPELVEVDVHQNPAGEAVVAVAAMFLCAQLSVEEVDHAEGENAARANAQRPHAAGGQHRERGESRAGVGVDSDGGISLADKDALVKRIGMLLTSQHVVARCCSAAALWSICRNPTLRVLARSQCGQLMKSLQIAGDTTNENYVPQASTGDQFCRESEVLEWVLGALYLLTEEDGVIKQIALVQGARGGAGIPSVQAALGKDDQQQERAGMPHGVETLVHIVRSGRGGRTESTERCRQLAVMLLWMIAHEQPAAVAQLISMNFHSSCALIAKDNTSPNRLRELCSRAYIFLEFGGDGSQPHLLKITKNKLRSTCDFLKIMLDCKAIGTGGLECMERLAMRAFGVLSMRSEFRPLLLENDAVLIVGEFLMQQPTADSHFLELEAYATAIMTLYNIILHPDCQ
ncbi:hypothetical protein CYMTET_24015, partial [Cymbomonas tetramitiformis]